MWRSELSPTQRVARTAAACLRERMPPTEACLRVPTFLGVHTLALSEELTLDGGALRVWTGAAEHHDPTADSATQLLAEQQRYRRSQPPSRSQLQQAGGAFGGGSLEARADQVFCSPPASGRRVLGGPFLRAALPSFDSASADSAAAGLLHVWLAAGGARSLADGGAAAGGAGAGAGGGAGGVIRRLGPYRLHVLSATIGSAGDETIAGAAAGDSLQPSETLTVTVAVDKVAAMAEAEVADAVRPTDELLCMALPQEEGEEACAWLSTQGAANPNQP